MLNRVDFPQPDGPSTQTNFLLGMAMEMSSSTAAGWPSMALKTWVKPRGWGFGTAPPILVATRRPELAGE